MPNPDVCVVAGSPGKPPAVHLTAGDAVVPIAWPVWQELTRRARAGYDAWARQHPREYVQLENAMSGPGGPKLAEHRADVLTE